MSENYIDYIAIDPNRQDQHKAEDRAATAFATLNGWRLLPHSRTFSPKCINRKHNHRNSILSYSNHCTSDIVDHGLYFKCGNKCVAIAAQPYDVDIEESREQFRNYYGLELYIPPDPLASFWFPGATFFVIIAAPHSHIQWLPEQDGRYIRRWELWRAEIAKKSNI
jgi:hypothetical protein